MSEKESRTFRKLILALEGKCHIVRPYPRCKSGKYPFCRDGKTANVYKYTVRCRE